MSEWLPISELFEFEKGTLQSSKCTAGDFDFITAAADWKTHDTYTHECEALVFAMAASGSLGRTHYVNGKFVASDLCFILTPKKGKKIDLAFYFRVFNFIREDIVKRTATGTSKLAINQSNFGNYKLPYFDLEHQILFRAKIDKISDIKNALTDEFANQQIYLAKLRQSILQEAIEGKLTADWRAAHPVCLGDPNTDAAALLAAIQTEKQTLIAQGKLKKEKPLPPIPNDEIPFALPEGWVWVRLGRIVQSITYGTSQSCSYDDSQNSKILRIPNVSNGYVDTTDLKYTNLRAAEITDLTLEAGDILVIRSNGSPKIVGSMVFLPSEFSGFCFAGYLIRLRFFFKMIGKYISHISVTGHVRNQIETPLRTTVGINNINTQELSGLLIPLPPLAEQHEIVARVDRLLASVNALEQQVAERQRHAEQLMQAVLKEAFAG